MAESTEQNAPENPTESSIPEGDAFDAKAFADKIEARISDIGKQLGKIHEWRKSLEPKDEGAKPESNGLTDKDLDAVLKLGETRARLPEAARAKLDAMREAGKSYAEIADMANILAEVLPANESKASEGAKPSESKTSDHPASGPRKSNGASVRTYREYQDLTYRARKGDGDAKRIVDALNRDPDFIPSSLPLK